jgi:PAS domain S-box-containing protein
MMNEKYSYLKRNIKELSTLLLISEGLQTIQSFREIGEIVFENLLKHQERDDLGGKLSVYDEEEDLYVIVYRKNYTEPKIPIEIACKLREVKYYSKIAIEQKKTLFINDNHSEFSLQIDERQKGAHEQSMVFIPVYYKEKLVGLFSYAQRHKNSIDEQFVHFLENIGNYLGGSIFQLLNEQRKKQAELKLVEERNLLRTIIDNSPDDIYVKDKKGNFILVNKAICKNKCTEPEEILGKSDFDLSPLEMASRFYSDEIKIIKDGQSLINQEFRFINREGKLRTVLITKVPLKNSLGDITGLIGYNRDYTDLKNTKKELQVLLEISNGLNTAATFKEIGKTIFESLQKLEYIDILNLNIYVYDDENDLLSIGFSNEQLKNQVAEDVTRRSKDIKEFVKAAIEEKRTIITDDNRMEYNKNSNNTTEVVSKRSLVFIPLYYKEKSVGVINVIRDKRYSTDQHFSTLLESIAKYVSIAIWEILLKNKKETKKKL